MNTCKRPLLISNEKTRCHNWSKEEFKLSHLHRLIRNAEMNLQINAKLFYQRGELDQFSVTQQNL